MQTTVLKTTAVQVLFVKVTVVHKASFEMRFKTEVFHAGKIHAEQLTVDEPTFLNPGIGCFAIAEVAAFENAICKSN